MGARGRDVIEQVCVEAGKVVGSFLDEVEPTKLGLGEVDEAVEVDEPGQIGAVGGCFEARVILERPHGSVALAAQDVVQGHGMGGKGELDLHGHLVAGGDVAGDGCVEPALGLSPPCVGDPVAHAALVVGPFLGHGAIALEALEGGVDLADVDGPRRAGGGLEYQVLNRHYAFGVAGDWLLVPDFDALSAIQARVFLRYTY